MTPPTSVSPAETLVDSPPKRLSLLRKLVLLLIFCCAQFLDSFNNSALYPAIPILEISMGITQSQSVWIISAFQLTFASFLLISGRISDVYNPKTTFIAGVSLLGVLSVGAGFVNDKIAIIVLRALMGIAAAMTIPSALALLVRVFPDPLEQARAIGLFGGCGAFANVLGLFIGAALVEYASYHWVFWFVAIVSSLVAFCSLLVIPSEIAKSTDEPRSGAKWKCLDLIGISILTVALILFIYAVTSASVDGWASAGVLAPLLISIVLTVGFFYWETLIPIDKAAIPPRTWFYTNFSVLFGTALFPFFWWSAIFLTFTTLWQDVFQWTSISTVTHMIPIGVTALAMSFTGSLSRVYSSKWIILIGLSMVFVATVLTALGGGRPDYYWPYIFPAFSIGSAGAMLIYTHTNIAIFQAAPASMAGTVGAIFNGALESGSAVGLAALSSIQSAVEVTHGGTTSYQGRAAAFWFLLGIAALEILSLSYFYRRRTDHGPQPTTIPEFGNGGGGGGDDITGKDDATARASGSDEEKSNESGGKGVELTTKVEVNDLPV